MAEKIEVLLAARKAETRESLKRSIGLEQDIKVIAAAVDGEEVIEKAKK